MNKKEIHELFRDLIIEKPCGVNWDTMSGDEKIRVCSQCNFKVHNLSSMTEREAALVLKRRQSERTCVYFIRRDDGSIVVDNCPEKLKGARNQIYAMIASLLVCTAYGIYFSAPHPAPALNNSLPHVIGLVGAPVDPRDSMVQVWDFGYDQARGIANFITAVSFIVVFFIPMNRQKKTSLRRTFLELLALATIPMLVHIAGLFVINNFGGLGGGM